MIGLKMIKLVKKTSARWYSEENDDHALSKGQTNILGSLKLSAKKYIDSDICFIVIYLLVNFNC